MSVLLLLLGVCLIHLIRQYCDCFTPLVSWILFLVFSLVFTLVSYFAYFVIFCRLSVCSSAVLAFFILFSNWSQSCLCYFIFQVYPYRSFSFVAFDRAQTTPLPCLGCSSGYPSTLSSHVILIVLHSFILAGHVLCAILFVLSLTASSPFVPAPFLHVLFYFKLVWVLYVFFSFLFFSEFTLKCCSLLLIIPVLQRHPCPASANLPVALPDCPATSFRLFCLCSFRLVMHCCSLLLILIVLQLHRCPASASLLPCRFDSSASAVC